MQKWNWERSERVSEEKNFLGCSDKLIEVGFDHIEWVLERKFAFHGTKQMWTGFPHATLWISLSIAHAMPKVNVEVTRQLYCIWCLTCECCSKWTLIGFIIHAVVCISTSSLTIFDSGNACTFLHPCETFSLACLPASIGEWNSNTFFNKKKYKQNEKMSLSVHTSITMVSID